MKIGTNLRKFRNRTKKSQEEVADLIGVERKTYAKWEMGLTDVKSSFIPKLAEILEVQISDLFGKENCDVSIKQQNISSSYNDNINSIILILPDKESVHDLVTTLKDKFGVESPKE